VVPILLQLLPSVFPPELTQEAATHIIGLVGLSDLYLLDSPLTLYGLSYGIPAIGDRHRNLTKSDTKFLVTTNHTVYFHMCEGFRADELLYVEATSPWAKDGRVFIESRIFQGSEGLNLVATCVQEVSCPNSWNCCIDVIMMDIFTNRNTWV
jgi:acyl-CoA thioesterase